MKRQPEYLIPHALNVSFTRLTAGTSGPNGRSAKATLNHGVGGRSKVGERDRFGSDELEGVKGDIGEIGESSSGERGDRSVFKVDRGLGVCGVFGVDEVGDRDIMSEDGLGIGLSGLSRFLGINSVGSSWIREGISDCFGVASICLRDVLPKYGKEESDSGLI